MTIKQKEIQKIISIVILAMGVGLVAKPLKEMLLSSISISPIVLGIIILAFGSYLFEIS